MRIAITGGPCSGKTTLLNALSLDGYACINEAALKIIKQLKREMGEDAANKWRIDNPIAFHKLVNNQQVRAEFNLNNSKAIYFFDRTRIDLFAYLQLLNQDTHDFEKLDSDNYSFGHILLLEQLTDYRNPNHSGRIESDAEAKRISTLLFQAYTQRGYRVTVVPELPLRERLDYCLSLLTLKK